jgi:uncharacterized SAM-binding protein YcdF (DUF218 family)
VLSGVEFFLKKVLEALLLPPFGPYLAMVVGALLVTRARIAGRVLFIGGAVLALVLSLPFVADYSQWWFEVDHPALQEIPVGVQAIVVLGGGRRLGAAEWGGETVSAESLERLRYAAWLAKLSHLPILVTGGMPDGGRHPEAYWMAQVLKQDYGVTARWQEGQSRDTGESARMSRALLAGEQITSIVLVTDVVHMPRALELFTDAGFKPVPAPVGFAALNEPTWLSFLPDAHAYARMAAVIHEGVGLGWRRATQFMAARMERFETFLSDTI